MTDISPQCLDMIALNLIHGLGPSRIKKLRDKVEKTEDIFKMSNSELSGVLGGKLPEPEAIRAARTSDAYREEIDFIKRKGIRVVCPEDAEYPASLRNIYDPPSVLYIMGDITAADEAAVAIVGSRRSSLYGIRTAETLARGLAERGVTVISGLARGIDSAAHRGAMSAGGRTIAVIGSGMRHIYPPVSQKFEREIRAAGAIVSEFPSTTEPSKGTFPRRNRIISGLAKGVVVVEAAGKSGALITSDFALEQGKEVFAVPGPIDSVTSVGTNRLIRDGAKLVASVDDILEEIDIAASSVSPSAADTDKTEKRPRPVLQPEQKKVMDSLSSAGKAHIDDIANETGMRQGDLHKVLLVLELAGEVKALPGSRYEVRSHRKRTNTYQGVEACR